MGNASIKSSNIEMYTLTLVITAFYYIGSAEGHEYPILHRLSNIQFQRKNVKNKAYKAFKLKKGIQILLIAIIRQPA